MAFTLAVDIHAAPADVFAFVADFTKTPQWYSAVQRVEHLSGDGGAGTRYIVHRRLPGGPAINIVQVSAYLAGQEVSFTSVEGPTPFTYRYRIQPASGGARLQLDGSISGAGLTGPAQFLGPFAERFFSRGMQDNLGSLKRLIEQPTSPRTA
ncbi:SRPBCC family protein [Microbacterium sp. ASV49]|uniref:SRPBCC family protein n=1 Tax=Microbacterium candidum TaxID=3041922 RepID=A0ABT7MXK7_9MICO|nr:SRPBCC family protein [Microbacterium sp. ASV49]MDL9979188.1 SRPBCC family protein [Microbacterium sp. ASV49]